MSSGLFDRDVAAQPALAGQAPALLTARLALAQAERDLVVAERQLLAEMMVRCPFFTDLIRYMVKDCCRMEFASIREDTKRGCSVIEMPTCCTPKGKEKPS